MQYLPARPEPPVGPPSEDPPDPPGSRRAVGSGPSRGLPLAWAVAWSALIWWVLTAPATGGQAPWPWLGPVLEVLSSAGADKLVHAAAFFVQALLLARLGGSPRTLRWRLFAVAVAGLYGGLTELAQLRVAGRSADLADWAADLVGAASILLPCRPSRFGRRRAP